MVLTVGAGWKSLARPIYQSEGQWFVPQILQSA